MLSYIFSNDDLDLMKGMFATEDPDAPEETRYILEEHHGFMLCVHRRNFIAGRPVMTNIANAVRMSRRTIVLLTR